jgi:IS1 family transposase
MEQVQAGAGSVWTWTAIDADTKLIISYTLGDRDADTAQAFMQDVASRISNRIQLTTDGIACMPTPWKMLLVRGLTMRCW